MRRPSTDSEEVIRRASGSMITTLATTSRRRPGSEYWIRAYVANGGPEENVMAPSLKQAPRHRRAHCGCCCWRLWGRCVRTSAAGGDRPLTDLSCHNTPLSTAFEI